MMPRIKVFHPPLYAWHDKLAIPSEDGDRTMHEGLFNITYQPLVDTTGQIYGVLSLSVEVAESGGARQVWPATQLHRITGPASAACRQ
jgi:hypothetical protein